MILGIDPGLENTGWAVVNYELRISNYKLLDYGVIKIKSKDRLKDIYNGVEKIIKKYKIKEMAVESMFFAKNAKSALKVSEAIGAIKVCGTKNGVGVTEYTPLQVKMALTGYGRAEKEQVEQMVGTYLKLQKMIQPSHAADAVAVALTHGFTMKY
ncbi:crossover junction endodeoxyribonuclease RuvC [Candidatus Shapirobacteria bacterium CG_4_10_14_0_2_um_filter_40_12]|uniref:Crossover junction endodeoxyribonuclease RuvC n=1 Tax=Candidatus Shapirobacteria bacterium CG_4_10_14_0_2_um_filter_40_12 TaxID=1974871 RepID=A0A2M7TSQ1_9BACT|nr:MAG: crossover junction endodeoxyribonuclease RuvC [Candidatus Shapirobacteria bacterium CG_4_10_14_0_2_um_filter_40_12]